MEVCCVLCILISSEVAFQKLIVCPVVTGMSYWLPSMSEAMCVLLFICINVTFLSVLLLRRVSPDCRWLSTGKLNNLLEKQKFGIPVPRSASHTLGSALGQFTPLDKNVLFTKEVSLTVQPSLDIKKYRCLIKNRSDFAKHYLCGTGCTAGTGPCLLGAQRTCPPYTASICPSPGPYYTSHSRKCLSKN